VERIADEAHWRREFGAFVAAVARSPQCEAMVRAAAAAVTGALNPSADRWEVRWSVRVCLSV
jgi:hypothetical protein